jgi:hypothetical protein
MSTIKSTTEITLPFGTMIMTREIGLHTDTKQRTTFKYGFGKLHEFLTDPINWNSKGERKDLRDMMVSEGGATVEEADGYMKILVGRQWNRRKGKHSMTINKGERY